MAEEEPASPTLENAATLSGIHRALPGLDSFLRDKLAREKLTPDVAAQLAHFVQILDQLEGDVAARDGVELRQSTSVSSDMDEENITYSGFLVQGTRHVSNMLAWVRRWYVLHRDDNVLRAYGMRSRVVQKPLWEIDLQGCRVALVDPRDAGDKTHAFRIVPPQDSGQQPLLLRAYEEAEMHRCVDALAHATGEVHAESELRTFLSVPSTAGVRLVSSSPIPSRAASSNSHRGPILPSGEEFEVDDGDGLYDIPPSRQAVMDSTYDVPPPPRSSAGPSRSNSDFDFPTDDQMKRTPPLGNGELEQEGDGELDMEDNYAELNFRDNRAKSQKGPRENSVVPEIPTRTSKMMVTSVSDVGSGGRASQTIREEQVRSAKDSYAAQDEDLYASMHDDLEDDDVHLSSSNTDDREGIYQELEFNENSDGYTSSGSMNSIVGWFKRNSNERKSGGQKKKDRKKKENKDRRHRLSRSVADLVEPDQDGYLVKRSGTGLTWRRRWCVLHDMCLYYFRSQDDNVARNAIILPGWKLVPVSEETKRPFTFKLTHDGMTDCFFSAENSDSYDTWIASLDRCLRVTNGGESIPYSPPPTKPKTKEAEEADQIFSAIDNLAAPQWGSEDVAASAGDYTPDCLYDHPRANAGSLASEGTDVTRTPTAPNSRVISPAAVSLGLDAPPVPNGPRPSPKPVRQEEVPDLPDNSTYQDVPRHMRRQDSEYDTELYLAPAEARSGRNTPQAADIRSRSTTPGALVSPQTAQATPSSAHQATPLPAPASAVTSAATPAAAFPSAGVEVDGGASPFTRTRGGGSGIGGFLGSFRKKKNVLRPSSIVVKDGVVEGVLNRQGAIKWSSHYCRMKAGHFYCYKGDSKGSMQDEPILNVRLLGLEVRNADREAKKSNSFSLMKPQRKNKSSGSGRHFQCDNDEDYRLWFKFLREASQIQVQAVSDVKVAHQAGRQPPATMDLTEARRIRSPPSSPPPHSLTDGESHAYPDSGDVFEEPLTPQSFEEDLYQVPRPTDPTPASAGLPTWLQDELVQKREAEAAAASTGKPIAGNPLWWALVSSSVEGIIQGPLSIKHGTMAATRSWKTHWCTVAEGRLNCFLQRSDTESVVEVQLGGQLLSHAPERGRPFCFYLFVDDKRALCISVELKKEMDEWMTLLLTAAQSASATAAEAEAPLHYQHVPKSTITAAKPVVRQQQGSSDVNGYIHEIFTNRTAMMHVSTDNNYYPPEPVLTKVAKAPLDAAAPVSPTQMPPVYKPAVARPDAGREPAMQAAPGSSTSSAASGNVHDGYLQKRSGPNLWHRRYCYLQGTTLHLYSQKGSQNAIQKQSLANCGLGVTTKDGKKDAFKVTAPSPHPRIYLQATSSKERAEWMDALQKAIVEASASTAAGVGLEARTSRSRLSFRRPKSNVISNSAIASDADQPPRRRGLIGRLRSWSQENLSRRSSRHGELVDPSGGDDAYGTEGSNQPQPFIRGAVSLGRGEFKRNVGGKPRVSGAAKSMSGILFLNYGNGEGSMWCKISEGRLSAFTVPQDRMPAYSTDLGGAHIKLSSHTSSQDRVITIDGGSLQQALQIRVRGPAKTFDDWVSTLQSCTVQEKPLKRSWSMRLRRSVRRNRTPAAAKRGSDPGVVTGGMRESQAAAAAPLDLATTGRPSPAGAPKPLGSRPLPRPPGQLPSLPQPPDQPASAMDSLLPGYASKLTSDLNALTSAVDDDTAGARKDSRTPSLPSEGRRPSQPLEAGGRKGSDGLIKRGSPEQPAEDTRRPTKSKKQKKADKGTPSPDIAARAEKSDKALAAGRDTGPPSANSSSHVSSDSLDATPAKKTPPPAPRRNDSMNNGPPSLPLPAPVIHQVKNSPRPRVTTEVQMAAPPPPPASMSDPAVYSDLLKEYEAKAKAVNVQAADQRTNLTHDRIDLVRQQVDLEDQIRSCNVRLATAEAKPKGAVFKARAGENPFEIKRERAELQNKGGWLEGKIQRIDDQILRVSTELATAIDRLEKERNQRIDLVSTPELESAM